MLQNLQDPIDHFFWGFCGGHILLSCELQQLKATWRLCSCFPRSIKVRTSQFSLVRTSQCLFYLAPYKCIRNCPCPKGKNYERQQKRVGRGTQARKVKSFVQGHLSQRQMEKYRTDCQHPGSVFPFCPENEARNRKKLTLLLFWIIYVE